MLYHYFDGAVIHGLNNYTRIGELVKFLVTDNCCRDEKHNSLLIFSRGYRIVGRIIQYKLGSRALIVRADFKNMSLA